MSEDADLVKLDLYALVGADPNGTKKDIKKAYRKKALLLHPDKNKDDPKAGDRFDQLQKAFQFLTDDKKRENYDNIRRCKESRKRRLEEQNAGRRDSQKDLERREALAAKEKLNVQRQSEAERAKFQTKREIDELLKSGLLKPNTPSYSSSSSTFSSSFSSFPSFFASSASSSARKKPKFSIHVPPADAPSAPNIFADDVVVSATVIVSWKEGVKVLQDGTSLDETGIRAMLGMHGVITDLLVGKRKAVVVFQSSLQAAIAMSECSENHAEITCKLKGSTGGHKGNAMMIPNYPRRDATRAHSPSSDTTSQVNGADMNSGTPSTVTKSSGGGDYEMQTLLRMMNAQKQKTT